MSAVDTTTVRDEEIDLAALVRIVWGRKFLVVGCAFAFAVVAVVLALTAKEIFRAEVTVVEVRDDAMGGASSLMNQFGGIASLVGVNLQAGSGTQDAMATLESRRLVEEFIKRYVPLDKLFPEPNPSKPPTLWLGVKKFREQVVTLNEDTRKARTVIAMEWTDPATAARWANDFIALANELVRARALAESGRNLKYLNEQLERTNVLELRKVLYNLIETETKRQMLANGRLEYAFTVVDPAVAPEIRVSPKRTLMVLIGGVLGGFIGVVTALLWHAISRMRGRIVN